MKTVKSIFSRLPIRWKLAVWSSLLLCILFVLYNGVQYFTINQWMVSEGEVSIRKSMNEIQNFFQQKQMSAQEIVNSRRFVEDMNDPHQMIRILNQQGTPLLNVSDKMPEDWFPPQTVQSTRIMTVWHLEDQVLIMRSPLNSGRFKGTIEIINNMKNLEKVSENKRCHDCGRYRSYSIKRLRRNFYFTLVNPADSIHYGYDDKNTEKRAA